MNRANAVIKSLGLLLLSGPLFSAPAVDPRQEPPAGVAQAVFHFDKDKPGQLPTGLTPVVSGKAPQAQWAVKAVSNAPSRPNVITQSVKGEPGDNFSLLLIDKMALENVDVTVKFKVLGDTENQAFGIVYRYQDPSAYRVALVDAKDVTCHLYRFVKGKPKKLETQAVIVTPEIWHTLRLMVRQSLFSLYVDGELAMGAKDKKDVRPGQVGLWLTGDTTVQFDDLTIAP